MISFCLGAFEYFFERPQSIIPSIIFYMVIYYLNIDLSMLFLSLLSLLTPILDPLFPQGPRFLDFLPLYLSKYQANRVVTPLFFFRFGDVSAHLLIAKSV
jgi:hypothetical protein